MKENYDNKKEIIRSLSALFGDVSKPLRASLIGLKIEKILSKFKFLIYSTIRLKRFN